MQKLKNISRWLLNLIWFAIAIVFFGQGTILVEVGKAFLEPAGAIKIAIASQAEKGNFIIFSSALVVASLYSLAREYNSTRKAIEFQSIKSLLILFGLVLVAVAVFYSNNLPMGYKSQPVIHWVIYWACMLETFFLWCIDEANNAKSFTDDLSSGAQKLQSGASKANDDGKGTKL